MLTIGTTVRETMFQPSFSLNGMTGWALSRKKVPILQPAAGVEVELPRDGGHARRSGSAAPSPARSCRPRARAVTAPSPGRRHSASGRRRPTKRREPIAPFASATQAVGRRRLSRSRTLIARPRSSVVPARCDRASMPPEMFLAVEAVLQQDARRVVGAPAGAADDEDLPVARQLAEPRAELRQRDVDRARHRLHREFRGIAHVEQEAAVRCRPSARSACRRAADCRPPSRRSSPGPSRCRTAARSTARPPRGRRRSAPPGWPSRRRRSAWARRPRRAPARRGGARPTSGRAP